jgi:hypothetical protein
MKRLAIVVVAACGSPSGPPTAGVIAASITSPSPGDELLAADHPTITVTGSVTTTSPKYGLLQAWVNGTQVDLAADGTFSVDITPDVGVNHLALTASDASGDIVDKQLDVMWAPDYLPPITGTTGFDVDDALDLHLGQRFFDGRFLGTTLDMSTDPVVAHDLAAALELIVWNIDLASLLSGGIHLSGGTSSLDISIPSATPAEVIVDAKVNDTPGPEIDLSIDLDGVFLATTGNFNFSGTNLDVEGGITADMHASATLALDVQPDGTILVTTSNITAVVGPLVPQFTGPNADELNGFITVGNSDFRTLVQNAIQNTLIPTFTNKLPPLLEALLGATDKLLDNATFTLDAMLGTPVTIQLNGRIGSLDVVAGPAIGTAPGHVATHQPVTITTTATPVHASSRGAARVSAMPVLPPTNTSSLHLLMSQDFLNATLHALWNSGLLDGTTTVGGLTAGVSAKLSPFVRPTPDSSACSIGPDRCDLLVELGQLEVTLPDFQQSFGVNISAGARVVVAGTTVSLVLQSDPTITVWETSDMPGRLTADAVHDLIANVVWTQVFGAIGDKLHITLPIPDLAALGLDQLSPKLANAQLQLVVNPGTATTDGYLGLGADVSLTTPHP